MFALPINLSVVVTGTNHILRMMFESLDVCNTYGVFRYFSKQNQFRQRVVKSVL